MNAFPDRAPRTVWSLALLVLALGACGGEEKPAAQAPTPLTLQARDLAIVRVEELGEGVLLTGTLAPGTSVSVKAQAPGTVSGLTVRDGDRVREGQVLASIEAQGVRSQAASAQASVAAAQANLSLARRHLESARTLYRAGAMAELEFRGAEAAAEAAEGQLAAARAGATGAAEQARRTVLRAPISGVVTQKLVEDGQAVNPGESLLTVVDPTRLQLEAAAPATQLGVLRVGAPVEFRVQGYEGRTFSGRIERINPVADPATRQIQLYATVPNPGGVLVAGLFAEGAVQTAARTVLAVPGDALDPAAQAPTVTRIRGGRTEQVRIQAGLRDERTDRVEVLGGLSAGDTVLVGAAARTTAGTPVRVGPAAPAAGR